MVLRKYKDSDKEKCIEVFDSNCPKFFDVDERAPFIRWLDHQANNEVGYESPTYKDAEKDAYYVIEIPDKGVIACGGFYIIKNIKEARLAWGMIHSEFHKQGYGTALYKYRAELIKKDWPEHTITLGTSQHTYAFYQKMGMNVTATVKAGYGPNLDRYDMQH